MLSHVVAVLLLALGFFATSLAQDLPETSYDESESQPSESFLDESCPSLSAVIEERAQAQAVDPETAAIPGEMHLQVTTLFVVPTKRSARPIVQRFTGRRELLSQVCTFLF
jgi:hypothetical protein